MKAVLDAAYRSDSSLAACVTFARWEDGRPQEIFRARSPVRAAYRAGRLYERELPGLLAVLGACGQPLETIVVDGYVHLQPSVGKGLGLHLYEALGGTTPVIGVAKTPLVIATHVVPIFRGRSRKPLFVSAVGCSLRPSAAHILRMHGPHRIPTLLRLADQAARDAIPAFPGPRQAALQSVR
jgi:deoxyribonuclease V